MSEIHQRIDNGFRPGPSGRRFTPEQVAARRKGREKPRKPMHPRLGRPWSPFGVAED